LFLLYQVFHKELIFHISLAHVFVPIQHMDSFDIFFSLLFIFLCCIILSPLQIMNVMVSVHILL